MSNTLVKVIAQYIDEDGKPKGCQEFSFYGDSDHFMYTPEEVLAEAIQSMIDVEMKRYCGSYTYVSHELIFFEPIALQSDFEVAINKAAESYVVH